MLNNLNPRNNTTNCSVLLFSPVSFSSTRHNSTEHTRRRDVRREKKGESRKACVNLIVEIKVDTYDDFANSL